MSEDRFIRSSWPRLMRAATAAAYVDERSVDAFRRGVGSLYPAPHKVSGKGDRWFKDELDAAIERIAGVQTGITDACQVLRLPSTGGR